MGDSALSWETRRNQTEIVGAKRGGGVCQASLTCGTLLAGLTKYEADPMPGVADYKADLVSHEPS